MLLDIWHLVYRRVGAHTHSFLSYLGSRGLFGRLFVRSLLSVPPDGRSGPEPGLTRLFKAENEPSTIEQTILFRAVSDEGFPAF